jgi:hypothetical protein
MEFFVKIFNTNRTHFHHWKSLNLRNLTEKLDNKAFCAVNIFLSDLDLIKNWDVILYFTESEKIYIFYFNHISPIMAK